MTEPLRVTTMEPRTLLRTSVCTLLRTSGEYLSMIVGLSMFALMCMVWLPCAILLRALLPVRWGRALGRRMSTFGFRLYLGFLTFFGFNFDLAELDALRAQGPLIIVANHPSLLDAVMIVSRFPNAVCIMKAALLDNPLFGAAARLARYIRNDDPVDMAFSAREELRSGAHLILFPEGTRTSSFPIGPCFDSAGLIAKISGVPVQSVVIEYSAPYLGKNWPLLSRPPLPLSFRIRLGRRFDPPQDVKAFTADLEQHFRDQLGHKA